MYILEISLLHVVCGYQRSWLETVILKILLLIYVLRSAKSSEKMYHEKQPIINGIMHFTQMDLLISKVNDQNALTRVNSR